MPANDTYTPDAYVIQNPVRVRPDDTHAVCVDIIDEAGVRHQIVGYAFGESNATLQAQSLNTWRLQTQALNGGV